MGEIDVIAAEATLGENDGELGGKLGFAEVAASTTMRARRGGSGRRRSALVLRR